MKEIGDSMENQDNKIKVMLATEGTYPHSSGGVSTWCDSLVKNLHDVDYYVYSIIMNPYINQKYELPEEQLLKVPLWGTDEPFEHLKVPFSQVFRARSQTTTQMISDYFVPLFKDIVSEIVSNEKDPVQMGYLLLDMYNYFRKFDYKETFKSEIIWDTFQEIILRKAADPGCKLPQPTVFSMIQSLGWLYRFFTILTTPIPKTDVSHSAAAAFCGVPCVLAKMLYNTPYLLTEHGVFLREQYLSLSKRGYDPYLNTFFIRMIKSIVKLNYAYADQISPVCHYNTRWETKFGVMPRKIKVIHNGVDRKYFDPDKTDPVVRKNRKRDINEPLRVVSIARVDPVKDLVSFIKSAEIIKEKIGNVTFHVYGSVSVQEYYEECKELVSEKGLEGVFIFEGNTDDVAKAYLSGDVIVLSSITEAFPYSVVEAMMLGKAVVATDVGGITEALEGCGVLVPPRKHVMLAEAVTDLLLNEVKRNELGSMARERALELFDLDLSVNKYYESYTELKNRKQAVNLESEKIKRQRLLSEKAYALIDIGKVNEGIKLLKEAIKEKPSSEDVPELASKISEAYMRIGSEKDAENERARAEYIEKVLKETKSA